MRHFREIGGEGVAFDGLTERERQIALRAGEGGGVQERAQEDGFALGVREFDADGVAAGDDGDARSGGVHGAGDVVGKADDAAGFHAGGGFEFEQGDDGAGAGGQDFALHAEIGEQRQPFRLIESRPGLAALPPARDDLRRGRRRRLAHRPLAKAAIIQRGPRGDHGLAHAFEDRNAGLAEPQGQIGVAGLGVASGEGQRLVAQTGDARRGGGVMLMIGRPVAQIGDPNAEKWRSRVSLKVVFAF